MSQFFLEFKFKLKIKKKKKRFFIVISSEKKSENKAFNFIAFIKVNIEYIKNLNLNTLF